MQKNGEACDILNNKIDSLWKVFKESSKILNDKFKQFQEHIAILQSKLTEKIDEKELYIKGLAPCPYKSSKWPTRESTKGKHESYTGG